MKFKTIITILLAIIALCMSSTNLYADIVKGRVVDAETKEPLPEAQLTIYNLDDGWVWAYLKSDSQIRLAWLFFHQCERSQYSDSRDVRLLLQDENIPRLQRQ